MGVGPGPRGISRQCLVTHKCSPANTNPYHAQTFGLLWPAESLFDEALVTLNFRELVNWRSSQNAANAKFAESPA